MMPRLSVVFVHAHPDDECILTGAVLAKATSLGMRTIVIYGTRGDAGETNDDLGGQSLGQRRMREALAACSELGVDRVEWLPYDDSGMANTETTANPRAFSNADPDQVAVQLAELLVEESVAAVVGYDVNGTYGHPDHQQVHRVAHRSAPALGAGWVLEATYNREYLASLPDSDGSLDPDFAAAEADLTHFVEGEPWLQAKLSAMAHHRSQIPSDWDVEKPDIEGFRTRFGTEWFIATPLNGANQLGPLASLLQPKAEWTGASSPSE
ncbi:MAG: GlcNAc-PI de-N-acetylase [Actinomycetia bacterium]|nr:GlcNAc-PI de-N-acetylase [Actinomycetes bacterium]